MSKMDIEIIKSRKRLITHGHCPDGLASAMLIRAALPGIEVVFCSYGSEQHKSMEAREGDLFCDFTPHRDRVPDFVEAGAVVLDHHRGAADIVALFGERGVFADEQERPGVSGATLAFEHVWKPVAYLKGFASSVDCSDASSFARTVGIRDTWQRDSPDWDRACAAAAALMFFDPDVLLSQPPWLTGDQFEVGRLLHEKRIADADKAARSLFRMGDMLIMNDTKTTSDTAEAVRRLKLGKHVGAQLVAGFKYKVDPDSGALLLIFSLRSLGSFDVAAMAKANGGGGHTKAAGFVLAEVADSFAPFTSSPFLILERARTKSERLRK